MIIIRGTTTTVLFAEDVRGALHSVYSFLPLYGFCRTIGFYNIQDNAILETTNNPLWAAAIYYRLREVEKDAATNQANDARAGRGLEQSCIQKYMALGILFNGGNK